MFHPRPKGHHDAERPGLRLVLRLIEFLDELVKLLDDILAR
jgi:hypothetical protein